MVPELESLTLTLPENDAPVLWVTVKPASACELPMVPPAKIALPVPEFKVKVRSLLEALSALTASLKTIPLPPLEVAVTVTFAPRTTSPVTLLLVQLPVRTLL